MLRELLEVELELVILHIFDTYGYGVKYLKVVHMCKVLIWMLLKCHVDIWAN
jgi:hypothetical protein